MEAGSGEDRRIVCESVSGAMDDLLVGAFLSYTAMDGTLLPTLTDGLAIQERHGGDHHWCEIRLASQPHR